MATDAELIEAVAAGDDRALDALCSRYERPLYQFLFRHGGARDVDDRYQETWLRVVAAASRYDPRRRFSTWLFQIALNLCRDARRRPPPEPVDPATIELAASGYGTARATEDALDAERLLAHLPQVQRSVVVLRYYCDFTEAEVAEILDCPVGTVKSRMHHALAHLAAIVAATPAPADIGGTQRHGGSS
jgi:RNA polymerase sigma-70 factor, ECF subfamily